MEEALALMPNPQMAQRPCFREASLLVEVSEVEELPGDDEVSEIC